MMASRAAATRKVYLDQSTNRNVINAELTGRVARLLRQCIYDQMQEYNISLSTIWVGSSSRREPVLPHERGVHIVKHVGPNLASS